MLRAPRTKLAHRVLDYFGEKVLPSSLLFGDDQDTPDIKIHYGTAIRALCTAYPASMNLIQDTDDVESASPLTLWLRFKRGWNSNPVIDALTTA